MAVNQSGLYQGLLFIKKNCQKEPLVPDTNGTKKTGKKLSLVKLYLTKNPSSAKNYANGFTKKQPEKTSNLEKTRKKYVK